MKLSIRIKKLFIWLVKANTCHRHMFLLLRVGTEYFWRGRERERERERVCERDSLVARERLL